MNDNCLYVLQLDESVRSRKCHRKREKGDFLKRQYYFNLALHNGSQRVLHSESLRDICSKTCVQMF